jgi:hypothetical protein
MDYADNISGTTTMFAFEVYGKREVSLFWSYHIHVQGASR